MDLCGGESYKAWKGCLDGLVARGLKAPLLCIIDGHSGLRRAVGEVWARAAVQRCCVVPLANFETEPFSVAELASEAFGIEFTNLAPSAPARYDVRSRFADFDGGSGFLYDKG